MVYKYLFMRYGWYGFGRWLRLQDNAMRQDPIPGSGNDFVSHQSISLVSETDTGGNGRLDGGHIPDYLDHRPA